MTTCSITGTIADMSLAPLEGVRLTFTPEPQAVADVDGKTGVPRPISLTSGPGGAVPEAEAAVLADLMDA
ncbi:hypothetical protein [Rhodosalinus sediminis]|jgi:hypothetical protein|uniref:hypothetical protein n=1 Tax=Rhodosalinus sediminis TaxID=1940533 RepID=UPI0023552B62|nr:hypothetical protein [Rhodosalinus sediminis]